MSEVGISYISIRGCTIVKHLDTDWGEKSFKMSKCFVSKSPDISVEIILEFNWTSLCIDGN